MSELHQRLVDSDPCRQNSVPQYSPREAQTILRSALEKGNSDMPIAGFKNRRQTSLTVVVAASLVVTAAVGVHAMTRPEKDTDVELIPVEQPTSTPTLQETTAPTPEVSQSATSNRPSKTATSSVKTPILAPISTWVLSANGLGPIKFDKSYADTYQILKNWPDVKSKEFHNNKWDHHVYSLAGDGWDATSCGTDVLAVVSVDSPAITTTLGVRVGMSLAEFKAAHPSATINTIGAVEGEPQSSSTILPLAGPQELGVVFNASEKIGRIYIGPDDTVFTPACGEIPE